MVAFTSDQWIILALVFVLGLLIGAFLLAGTGRKWKTRYRDEVREREALEERHREREREWDERQAEWRERDSLREAALKDRERDSIPASEARIVELDRDTDNDGVRDEVDRRPTDDRRA